MSVAGAAQPDATAIGRAVDVLAAGDVIGLPTETVYGLAADAGRPDAVERIYRIKGRPPDHPLIVHVHDATVAARWGRWRREADDRAERLARALWPGPLTLVLPRAPAAPAWACAGQPTIALRVPSHPVAKAVLAAALARGIDGLAIPSANRFGRVSPTRAAHVRDDLAADVPMILDGGDCEVGIESTIVDLSGPVTRVLRPGAITAAQIDAALAADATLPATSAPVVPAAGADVPRVPGSLRSHYAPITRLTLCPPERLAAELVTRLATGARLAVWSRRRPEVEGDVALVWRQCPDDPVVFAHELYDAMRSLDALHCDGIVVEQPPDSPQWAGINDRLGRASDGSVDRLY